MELRKVYIKQQQNNPSHTHTINIMIRAFFFDNEQQLLSALTKLIGNHYNSTRFIRTPHSNSIAEEFFPSFRRIRHFSLALSGGTVINKMLQYWHDVPSAIDFTYNTDYYWLNECCVPYNDQRSVYGNAHQVFFRHTHIPPEKIHPIRYYGQPEDEAHRYASQLPSSSGIQYNPTLHLTDSDKTLTNFCSPYHCAVITLDDNCMIPSTSVDSPLIFSDAPYYTFKEPHSQLSHIAASMNLLSKIPRIVIALMGEESSQIIEDLYYGNNTHHPMKQLLLQHPNVHILIDNKKMETVIYPDRQHIGYFYPGDCINIPKGTLDDLIKF